MKISIITPTFNSQKTIKDCLNSIKSQEYKNFEHIVIDGASTDGTQEIIKKYKVNLVSELDNGIYDAMNKGIKVAQGDIVGILNSDDMYYDEYVLNKVETAFKENDCDIVFANIVCVDQNNLNKVIRNYRVSPYNEKMFYKGGHPPHPAFFVKKSVYEKYGYFSLKYKISSDYEFMLRVLVKYKLKSAYIDEYLVRMRVGGVSNNSIKSIIRNNKECKEAWKDNGLKPPFGFVFRKPLSKIKQFFIK